MGNPEDKIKHSRRIKQKKKARVRSVIAKELIVSGKYKQRIVKAKGKEYDLNSMTHADLVRAIQDTEDYGDE